MWVYAFYIVHPSQKFLISSWSLHVHNQVIFTCKYPRIQIAVLQLWRYCFDILSEWALSVISNLRANYNIILHRRIVIVIIIITCIVSLDSIRGKTRVRFPVSTRVQNDTIYYYVYIISSSIHSVQKWNNIAHTLTHYSAYIIHICMYVFIFITYAI